MQGFIAVAFGDGQPVTESLGVGQIHVGHDGVSLPAFLFFLVNRGVEDNADGKQIVYTFERTALFLHLLIDGMDGLGASFDVEFQPGLFQLSAYRFDESVDIPVACCLGGIQFVLDVVIDVVLCIFQR